MPVWAGAPFPDRTRLSGFRGRGGGSAGDGHGVDQGVLGGGARLEFGDEGGVELLEAVLGFAFEDDGLRQEPWRIPFWEEMALPSPVTGPLDLAPWARAESILRCELIRRQDGARVCVRVGAKRGRIWRGRG